MALYTESERYFREVRCTLHTRPNDLDVLGHVNNAVVLEYLEAARWNWARHMSLELIGRAVVVVTRIEVEYLAEMPYGPFDVTTQFASPGPDWHDGTNYKALVHQSIMRGQDDTECVRAQVGIAFLDAKTRALSTLQDCLAR